MNNLLKLAIVVIGFTMGSQSYAQTFGVKGGLNLSNFHVTHDIDTEISADHKMKPGYHLGVTADFPITELFSFETGLILSTKGFQQNIEEDYMGAVYKMDLKTNLLYLDIPLTAKVLFPIGDSKIYGVFGPYVGVGLSGKGEYSYSFIDEESGELDVKWGSDANEDDFKRLDFGLIIGAGVEISSIQIGLSYGLGLANISAYTDDNVIVKNGVLSISVGYLF